MIANNLNVKGEQKVICSTKPSIYIVRAMPLALAMALKKNGGLPYVDKRILNNNF